MEAPWAKGGHWHGHGPRLRPCPRVACMAVMADSGLALPEAWITMSWLFGCQESLQRKWGHKASALWGWEHESISTLEGQQSWHQMGGD